MNAPTARQSPPDAPNGPTIDDDVNQHLLEALRGFTTGPRIDTIHDRAFRLHVRVVLHLIDAGDDLITLDLINHLDPRSASSSAAELVWRGVWDRVVDDQQVVGWRVVGWDAAAVQDLARTEVAAD